MKYAAFLRGINVGGNKIIKMDQLKKAFESAGLRDVKTILASGNVVFDSPKQDNAALARKISEGIKKSTGRETGVIVRGIEELERMGKSGPFKGIKVTEQTRLYVTFLPKKAESRLKIPYQSPDGNFRIIRADAGEVFTVLTVTPEARTVDLMAVLDKEYGKSVTTRNWNTVEKVLKAGKE